MVRVIFPDIVTPFESALTEAWLIVVDEEGLKDVVEVVATETVLRLGIDVGVCV